MQRIGWRIPAAWLTLCIVWSSTWLAIKVGLRDLPPISFVAIRFLIAIVALSAVSVGRVRLLPLHRADYVVLALTGILMFAVNYTLLFWGELYVSSGLAAVLQATIPIFGMIFAHWMLPDEPLRLQSDSDCARNARGLANDFRCHTAVHSWLRRRWESGAFSLEHDVDLLFAVFGGHWIVADFLVALLAPAAHVGHQFANNFADYSTRRGDVGLGTGR